MDFDPTKPVQLAGGENARIYKTDCGGQYPIHGAFWPAETGHWVMAQWRADGTHPSGGRLRLVNVPEKRRLKGWVNVYKGYIGGHYETKSLANFWAGERRIACVEIDIEYTVGEGLEHE